MYNVHLACYLVYDLNTNYSAHWSAAIIILDIHLRKRFPKVKATTPTLFIDIKFSKQQCQLFAKHKYYIVP